MWHQSSRPQHQGEANRELAGEKEPHKSDSASETWPTSYKSGEDRLSAFAHAVMLVG